MNNIGTQGRHCCIIIINLLRPSNIIKGTSKIQKLPIVTYPTSFTQSKEEPQSNPGRKHNFSQLSPIVSFICPPYKYPTFSVFPIVHIVTGSYWNLVPISPRRRKHLYSSQKSCSLDQEGHSTSRRVAFADDFITRKPDRSHVDVNERNFESSNGEFLWIFWDFSNVNSDFS